MCQYWNELAKADGFKGIYFIFKYAPYKGIPSDAKVYYYQPHWAGWHNISFAKRVITKLLKTLNLSIYKPITFYDYDKIWNKILKQAAHHNKTNHFHGAFVNYDDSPRRGKFKSIIIKGGNPEKFKKYFTELVNISSRQNKEYIFLTAWNEWGEGAYLEPDTTTGMKYLEGIRDAMKDKSF